jgi:predicted phosphodiesterase
MNIDFISDLHIDSYIKEKDVDKNFQDNIINHFNQVFFNYKNGKRKILLISGDFANKNKFTFFALKVLEKYYYDIIIFILGNHDYFVSKKEIEEGIYSDSFDRIKEVKKFVQQSQSLFYLDGDIIEIEGIKIGGANGWYDGSYSYKYAKHFVMDEITINTLWKEYMPDSKAIKGIKDYKTIFNKEINKIDKIYNKVDIMMTHINPSFLKEHLSPRYKTFESNAFYAFNGHKFLKNGNIKYWICGHTHEYIKYEYKKTIVIANPLGYPNESNNKFRFEDNIVKTLNIK